MTCHLINTAVMKQSIIIIIIIPERPFRSMLVSGVNAPLPPEAFFKNLTTKWRILKYI